ncbi:MAG: universal stress protein [Candidatus Melainabacteria bacterium]|nr:universal stress protein [Candidatus Melainabacteria bacterium]
MRILIAVDFGLYGKAQIEMMRKLGCNKDTRLKVLHVIEPLCWELQTGYPATMKLSDTVINDFRDSATKLIQDVAGQLKEACSAEVIDTEIREGNISNEILAAAESFDADLLIVGSHGKSGIARFLLGSSSLSVSTHAKCSVLIARLDEVLT